MGVSHGRHGRNDSIYAVGVRTFLILRIPALLNEKIEAVVRFGCDLASPLLGRGL
jgi:hypothetical protein